jgi:hypothetical protein
VNANWTCESPLESKQNPEAICLPMVRAEMFEPVSGLVQNTVFVTVSNITPNTSPNIRAQLLSIIYHNATHEILVLFSSPVLPLLAGRPVERDLKKTFAKPKLTIQENWNRICDEADTRRRLPKGYTWELARF